MNVMTSLRTYATVAKATARLEKVLDENGGLKLHDVRWLVGVSAEDPTHFVPTLVGAKYCSYAQLGIMVIG